MVAPFFYASAQTPCATASSSSTFTQDFETGSSDMKETETTYASSEISSRGANSSSYGIHMQGGSSSSGFASYTSGSSAFLYNTTHIVTNDRTICATSDELTLTFDLEQTYTYAYYYSWFRLTINGTPIASTDGTTYHSAPTQNLGTWNSLTYDLSPYTGTEFTIGWEACLKYRDNYNGYAGDIANVDNISIAVESTVSVGTNSTYTYYNPYWAWYNYSTASALYLASEVNNFQTFNSLSWYVNTINCASTVNNVTIYMAHETTGSITSGLNSPIPANGQSNLTDWTLVYSGSITVSATGWKKITLDTKFDYNGIDNLLIAVENRDGSYISCYPKWAAESTSGKDLYDYSDGSFANASDNYSTYGRRPIIKLDFESDCSYDPGTVSGGTTIITSSGTLTTDLTLAGSGGTSYQWQQSTDLGDTWTNCGNSTATASTYSTPYLGRNTSYRAQVSDGSKTCYTTDNGNQEHRITVTRHSNDFIWTGETSTVYETATNWSGGAAPGTSKNVYIGNEYTYAPNWSNAGSGYLSKLKIQEDATMTHSSIGGTVPWVIGDFVIAGTWTQTGTGTPTWFPVSDNSILNFSGGTTTSLNLKVNAAPYTVSPSSNLSLNSINIGSGELNMAGYSLTVVDGITIGSNGTFNVGTSGLTVGGDFTAGGSIDGSNTTMTFNGTSTQQITSNGVPFQNITVNKTGGTLNMMDDMKVTGTLTLTDGNIKTNGNILELTSEDPNDLTGFSKQSFIIAKNAAGALRRHINNNGSNTDTYAYPIGTASSGSNYRRFDLINDGLAGGFNYLDVYVEVNAESDQNIAANSVAEHFGEAIVYFSEEEWMMVPDAEPATGEFGIRLYLENITTTGWALENNKFTIVKRPTGSSNFNEFDTYDASTIIPNTGATGRLATDAYTMRTGFTDFSGSKVGGSEDPLPIDLVDFNATAVDGVVDINWTTESEVNNDFFTVERSKDAVDFEIIVTVPGAGNSNEVLYYETTDDGPLMGVSYYRLKQTDYDGKFTYSKIVAVKNLKDLNFNIMPNPTTERLTVTFGKVEGSTVFVMTPEYNAKIKIFNTEGKLVYKKKFDGTFYKFNIDVSQLPEGMYYVNLRANDQIYKANFLKQ